MADGGSISKTLRPSAIDLLIEVPNARDSGAPEVGVDSRLRIGSARRDEGATRTDAELVQHVLSAIPAAQHPAFSGDVTVLPSVTDPHAEVKRALRYDGPTGFGLVTTGQLSKYLGGNEVTRIVDGSFRVHAVDQAPGGPVLSYLRLGKAEPQLGTDHEGRPVEGSGTPLALQVDRARDAKYTTGIGAYTEGEVDVYARGGTSFHTDGAYTVNSRGYSLSSFGQQVTAAFDGGDADGDGIAAPSAAADPAPSPSPAADAETDTNLVSIDWKYKRADGWYKQSYERAKKVAFSTSNAGEIATSAKYSLSAGASFDHKFSAGLSTGYSATVEVKGESKIKVTANGFESDTLFGKFSVAGKTRLAGNESVDISCASLVDQSITPIMQKFATAVRAAVIVQNAAFLAYETALAIQAAMTSVEGGKAPSLDKLDAHGFATAFKKGPEIYEAALILSGATCAAGILLAAVQAALSKVPEAGLTPKIAMTPFYMKLSCGPETSILMNGLGITMQGLRLNMRGIDAVVGAPRASFRV